MSKPKSKDFHRRQKKLAILKKKRAYEQDKRDKMIEEARKQYEQIMPVLESIKNPPVSASSSVGPDVTNPSEVANDRPTAK